MRTWVKDLSDPENEFRPLIDTERLFTYLHHTESTMLFTTDVGAPLPIDAAPMPTMFIDLINFTSCDA